MLECVACPYQAARYTDKWHFFLSLCPAVLNKIDYATKSKESTGSAIKSFSKALTFIQMKSWEENKHTG
jgi:hypothetical protein